MSAMFRDAGHAVMDADAVRIDARLSLARRRTYARAERGDASGTTDRDARTQTVHELYAPNGGAVAVVREMFGENVLTSEGGVDRGALGKIVVGDEAKMRALEAAVHPLVERAREAFVAKHADAVVLVFDIPLLYEKGYETSFDAVCVVSTGSEAKQRERVLRRSGMTPEKLDGILARQMPDAEKRARADYVIDTSCSLEETRARVSEILREMTKERE